MAPEPLQTLVIVPTYNERDNLPEITRAVHEHLPFADILVVDDNSPDGTGEVADRLAAGDSRIKVLHRAGKQGLGTAYIAGFRQALSAHYQFIFEMDCDFSHDPKYLPALLDRALKGADLVLGSRYIDGGGTVNWGPVRKLISRGGSLYARTILGVHVRDLTGGFKCFRRRVLESIDLDTVSAQGYGFQIEMTYRALKQGFRIEEVPIVFVDRRVGQSKMSKKIFLEALTLVWKLRLGEVGRAVRSVA
jgi:dolichol-phosphate mannosyltransferase